MKIDLMFSAAKDRFSRANSAEVERDCGKNSSS